MENISRKGRTKRVEEEHKKKWIQEREKKRTEKVKKHYWGKESHKRKSSSAWWNNQNKLGENTTAETKGKTKKEKTSYNLWEQWLKQQYGRKWRGIHWYKWRPMYMGLLPRK